MKRRREGDPQSGPLALSWFDESIRALTRLPDDIESAAIRARHEELLRSLASGKPSKRDIAAAAEIVRRDLQIDMLNVETLDSLHARVTSAMIHHMRVQALGAARDLAMQELSKLPRSRQYSALRIEAKSKIANIEHAITTHQKLAEALAQAGPGDFPKVTEVIPAAHQFLKAAGLSGNAAADHVGELLDRDLDSVKRTVRRAAKKKPMTTAKKNSMKRSRTPRN